MPRGLIYCVDPRFNGYLAELIRHISKHDPDFDVKGVYTHRAAGPDGLFSHRLAHPEDYHAGLRLLRRTLNVAVIYRLVIVGHEDCKGCNCDVPTHRHHIQEAAQNLTNEFRVNVWGFVALDPPNWRLEKVADTHPSSLVLSA